MNPTHHPAMPLIWYFDFISPYAYLQFTAHPVLFAREGVTLRPVVFAGLLKHWGHKGPVEIPAKRIQTYRQAVWIARERGVTLKCPPAHPFNPIPTLRLATALGATHHVVSTIFNFIWRDGRSVDDEWHALCSLLDVTNADELINASVVKQTLRIYGEAAIAAGVFGVPTFSAGGELFWGEDATPMLRAYLADRTIFDSAEMRRISFLPAAAERKA